LIQLRSGARSRYASAGECNAERGDQQPVQNDRAVVRLALFHASPRHQGGATCDINPMREFQLNFTLSMPGAPNRIARYRFRRNVMWGESLLTTTRLFALENDSVHAIRPPGMLSVKFSWNSRID